MPESREKQLITRKITWNQLFGNYKIFFSSRQAILLLVSLSFTMSGMFVFITSSSFMYLDYFSFDATDFPILFGANVVLNVVLSFVNNRLLKSYEPQSMLRIGLALQLIAGLIMFISSIFSEVIFISIFVSVVLYVGSLGMVFGNGTAIILNLMPEISGSANAMIGVTRFMMSFLIGSLPAIFYNGTLIPIAATMLGCSLLGGVFFIFYKKQTTER